MSSTRQLAAIMFTDIVGYTAMMQEDENNAASVRKRHREVFENEHANFNGKLLQYYGDGTLSTFSSAVEAVRCAVKMQQELQSGTLVPVRIGIHLGDIVHDDEEIYGDGVNLASRIESIAVNGSVLISDNLQNAIKSQADIQTQSLGHFEFKNVKQTIEVFCIKELLLTVPSKGQLEGKLKTKTKSIAVLPFVNMSSDPENEYFSDGIAEEILNALTKVKGLQVTARTSSFSFKGMNKDVREIGKELNVAHILEGSVRKSGNRVRITAQLVSSIDGYHFFSETYDRTLEDIFEVQDELAQKITNRLRQHLGEDEYQTPLVTVGTDNVLAYETYLKGLFYFNQWGDNMRKSIPYFEKAIEIQEDFALPHTKLVLSNFFQAFGGVVTWEEAYNNSAHHLTRARELKADSAEYYFAEFVYAFFAKWDWKKAKDVAEEGLQKHPNFASLYHAQSSLHWLDTDMPAATEWLVRGFERDPLSPEMLLYVGTAYLWNNDLENARVHYKRLISMLQYHRTAYEYLGWAEYLEGNYQSAIEYFNKLEPANGYRFHRASCQACAYFKLGDSENFKKKFDEVKQWESSPSVGLGAAMDMALVYTHSNDHEKAFEYLLKALENKVGSIMFCRTDPMLIPMFNDERLQKIKMVLGNIPKLEES